MQALDAMHRALGHISRWAVWLGGAALLISALIVTVDVISRKVFNATLGGSDEISGYVFAASTTWAYSYCLLNRSNVRIDVLYNFLPERLRSIMDVVGLALLLYYMGYLTSAAYEVFHTSWMGESVSNTTLGVSLWIPQLAWVLGLALFVFTLAFMLLYTLIGLLKGNDRLVRRLAGAMSAQEEIEMDTHGLDVKANYTNQQEK